jgi:small subunit ribosomal protein S14
MQHKYLRYSDLLIRKNFTKIEQKRFILKAIIHDLRLSKKIRDVASNELMKFKHNTYLTQAKNRCLFTNRSRWVIRKFKVSRMQFKKMASKGLLEGVKKSSW